MRDIEPRLLRQQIAVVAEPLGFADVALLEALLGLAVADFEIDLAACFVLPVAPLT